jgi:putative Mg2+ transporter-C (MgtC) family protein
MADVQLPVWHVALPENIARLLVALVLGGLVGLEREVKRRPGGLRTNTFICFGSALYMVVSEVMAHRMGGDPQRIAAQIIPGMGFLGAGAILRDRGSVTGLTSAATIFMVAAIGMAAGGGMYYHAIFATVIAMAVLAGFGWIEQRYRLKTTSITCVAATHDVPGAMAVVTSLIDRRHLVLTYMRSQQVGENFVIEFGVSLPMGEARDFVRQLRAEPVIVQLACTGATELGK